MTIKQQGGIFGRNPTFNDVDVDSTLNVGSGDFYVSGKNVGVGNTSPASLISGGDTSILSIGGGDAVLTTGDKVGTISFITSDPSYIGTYSDGIGAEIACVAETATGAGMGLAFYTGVTTASNRAERLRIDYDGDVTVHSGNLVIGTSGKGIDFSATSGTGTSELLDDYEEGSFSPAVEGTSTAGAGTYNSRSGRYVKVGQMVYAEGWINMTAHTGSGNLKITGLPYASASPTTAIRPVPFYVSNLAVTSGAYVIGRLNNSSTEILLYEILGGSASQIPLDTNFSAAFSATYYAS